MKLIICVFLVFLTGCEFFSNIQIKSSSAAIIKDVGYNEKISKVRPYDELLLVSIQSNLNLIDLAKKTGSLIYVSGEFCNENKRSLIVSPDVFYKEKRINDLIVSEDKNVEFDYTNKEYQIKIYLGWNEIYKNDDFVSFDLKKQSMDICIYIYAYNMFKNVNSNTIIISKDEISNLLDNM